MRISKKIASALLALGIVVGICACSSNVPADTSSEPPASSAAEESVAETEPAAVPEAGHYPVTITTYNYAGDDVVTTYEKAPEKVICVYQGCIETMIALGLEDHVIKSYGLDNPVKEEWSAGFANMKYDDTVFAPDKETVVMQAPDMIFSWSSYFGEKMLGDVDYWLESGVNTYINTNTRGGGHPRTLENEYTDILNIGRIFDVEDKAQAIVDEMRSEIADALAASAGKDKKTVAIIEFLDPMRNYGAGSLGGDMVTQLGAQLAMADAKDIGNEDLIASDPEIIFVVYMPYDGEKGEDVMRTQMAKILEEPALASLSAVQNGAVYPIMLGDMFASSARAIDGIRTFAQGIYPELDVK